MAAAQDWLPRLMAEPLKVAMADTPVVCVLGPRQSGKTSLVRRAFPRRHYVTFDDDTARRSAEDDPADFVSRLPRDVTLDEVQRVPAVLPAIKMAVDHDRRAGRFLLTGSANLLFLPKVSESLAGRMEAIHLYPLTELEKEKQRDTFVSKLLSGTITGAIRSGVLDQADLAGRLVRGGYPEVRNRSDLVRVRKWHREYVAALIRRDAPDAAKLRNMSHLSPILKFMATLTGQLLEVESVVRRCGVRRETAESNIAAIERLFLIRRLPAWSSRSTTRLVKTPKVHLIDSGLSATLSGLEPDDWNSKREEFGRLVESFAIQQTIAQAEQVDSELEFFHYRDKDMLEVALVIVRGSKIWGVEVKGTVSVTKADGAGLRRLANLSGRNFQGGVMLYPGLSTVPLGDKRMLAVPLSALWGR